MVLYLVCVQCLRRLCGKCHGLLESSAVCQNPDCSRIDTEVNDTIFLELPLDTQIETFFQGELCLLITAVACGILHLLLQSLAVIVVMNTDGAAVFKSSNLSLWPVYFVINELPPHLR